MQSNLPADMNKHTMDDGDDHRNGDGDRSKSSSLPPQPGFEAAVADMRSANNRMGIGTARIIAPQEVSLYPASVCSILTLQTYVGKGKGRAQNPISAGSPGSGGLGQRIQQQHKVCCFNLRQQAMPSIILTASRDGVTLRSARCCPLTRRRSIRIQIVTTKKPRALESLSISRQLHSSRGSWRRHESSFPQIMPTQC
jgi:hypothetical protein